jgi:hypothetical protein
MDEADQHPTVAFESGSGAWNNSILIVALATSVCMKCG